MFWTGGIEGQESGGQIDTINIDLEKDFDKVPHKRLISKVHSNGVKKENYRMDKCILEM
jgi:hypothetical protein